MFKINYVPLTDLPIRLPISFGMTVADLLIQGGRMYFSNAYGLGHQQVLTGFFKSDSDVRHAREILTDFGYPKEAAEVIEVNTYSRLMESFGRYIFTSFKNKALLGVALGIGLIFVGFAAIGSFYLRLSFYEIAALFAIWFVLISIGVIAASLVGALVAALIGPIFAAEFQEPTATEKKNVLISVAVRTPTDAQDLAREWEEIGGKVV
jgi:hypothetical protein